MKFTRLFLLAIAVALAGCSENQQPVSEDIPDVEEQRDYSADLLALTNAHMAEVTEASPYLRMMSGMKVEKMADLSPAAALRDAEKAQVRLADLAKIDRQQLSHDDQLTYDMFEGLLRQTVEAEKYYWHDFGITPYAAGFTFSGLIPRLLASSTFESAEDVDRYLGFLQDIGRYIEDDLTKLKGQEERGILLPKAALPGARQTVVGIGGSIAHLAAVSDERTAALAEAEQSRLAAGIELALTQRITPAVDALLDYLGDDYMERAPEAVGLGQYPGGLAAYQFAIRQQTTLDLPPEEIHRRGLAYMAEIQAEMAEIRNQMEFEGSQAEFHEQMRNDPRFFAATPEEVAERYMAYVRRIEPHIADYFSVLPKAAYGVKRLDPAAEPGMTFGYYQTPSPSEPVGYYRFNGSKLDERPMVWTAALVYHELVPGHHFHIALQNENENFSPFRKNTGLMYAAFTEGWANYSASLAFEMGIMDDPWDRYGWLLFKAFLANRLVVDTGMNAMGWSLEEAREYMTANTFSGADEVKTETLRYSTDMPAQALAYKLGYEKIREIRATQEKKLGDAFDIKKFHAATVGSGAMPMALLEKHVDLFMKGTKTR
ncbi:MAG: DUF885 domain-containing protein [Pseudomonadales bacterium]|nr:DUF885 domain-containing protein [Pseudomonadales bacterium]